MSFRRNLFISILLIINNINRQNNPYYETLRPYLQNFSADEYKAHHQNWAVVQDDRGIIYVANEAGLFEYDGTKWRNIAIVNGVVKSLSIDKTNRIWVDGFNEIGYLESDKTGNLHYISGLDKLDSAYHHFGEVWSTHCTEQFVYFRSYNRLMRTHLPFEKGSKLEVLLSINSEDSLITSSFKIDNNIYIRQRNVGLYNISFQQDTIKFFKDTEVTVLFKYNMNSLLAGTFNKGLYMIDSNKVKPFETEADKYLKHYGLIAGVRLTYKDYIIGTLGEGMVWINRDNGKIQQIVNEQNALESEEVKDVFEDKAGGIWLALEDGISRVDCQNGLSYLTHFEGKKQVINGIIRFENRLYLATEIGVFYSEVQEYPDGSKQMLFKKLEGLVSQCWGFVEVGGRLLVATNEGVFEIKNLKFIKIAPYHSNILYLSETNENRVFVSGLGGLSSVFFQNNKWVDEGFVVGVDDQIKSIFEDRDSSLWLGTFNNGVLRIKLTENKAVRGQIKSLKRYTTENRLGSNNENYLFYAPIKSYSIL